MILLLFLSLCPKTPPSRPGDKLDAERDPNAVPFANHALDPTLAQTLAQTLA